MTVKENEFRKKLLTPDNILLKPGIYIYYNCDKRFIHF
jgi:hypothetical protein